MAKNETQGRPAFRKGEKMKNYTIGLYPSMMDEIEGKCIELDLNPKYHRSKIIRDAVRHYIDTEAYKGELKTSDERSPTAMELVVEASEIIQSAMWAGKIKAVSSDKPPRIYYSVRKCQNEIAKAASYKIKSMKTETEINTISDLIIIMKTEKGVLSKYPEYNEWLAKANRFVQD